MRDFKVIKTGKGESDWEVRTLDDLHWFLIHWIIVQKDGTPVLNGSPEEFEKQLRALIEKNPDV